MPRRARSALPAAACLVGLLAAGAGRPAGAHVEPEVETAPAGSLATVELNVEHGCDGSPTVKLELQPPEAVTDARPVAKPGWTGAVVDGVVTYTGGSLPDDRADTFGLQFTVPDAVGSVLRFPMIQTCETGSIDWIQTEADGDRPAPTVEVAAADPSAPTAPATPPTTAVTTTGPTSSTTTADLAAAPGEDGDAGVAAPPATSGADDDSGSTTAVVAVVAVVAVAVLAGAGGAWWVRRRRADAP